MKYTTTQILTGNTKPQPATIPIVKPLLGFIGASTGGVVDNVLTV